MGDVPPSILFPGKIRFYLLISVMIKLWIYEIDTRRVLSKITYAKDAKFMYAIHRFKFHKEIGDIPV